MQVEKFVIHSLQERKQKSILQGWNSLTLLRHSYLILITDAHVNKAYYSASQR
jgi:hypothetical protein